MGYYIGLDVSNKQTSMCVLFSDGNLAWQGEVDTGLEFISAVLSRWGEGIELVGLETGSLTPWLARGLRDLGFPVVVMDARRAADAIKARPVKTDRSDARALAEMLRTGWFTEVYVKSTESHRLKALLSARDQLVRSKRRLLGQIRGLLRPFGIKLASRQGSRKFDEAVRLASQNDDVLYICVSALLESVGAIEAQIAVLDKQVRDRVRGSKICQHLMSVPGVGQLTALAFVAAIEDPGRFKRSRNIGAYLGLTPRRYQSGEKDVTGTISKQGDHMARHLLYEAANCLLTTWRGRSALKSWGIQLARRIGTKKARVAVARKLGCLLLKLWKEQTNYEESMRQKI